MLQVVVAVVKSTGDGVCHCEEHGWPLTRPHLPPSMDKSYSSGFFVPKKSLKMCHRLCLICISWPISSAASSYNNMQMISKNLPQSIWPPSDWKILRFWAFSHHSSRQLFHWMLQRRWKRRRRRRRRRRGGRLFQFFPPTLMLLLLLLRVASICLGIYFFCKWRNVATLSTFFIKFP